MRSIYRGSVFRGLILAFLLAGFGVSAFAQSALQDHPTPLTRSDVEATIKARDVGDARLTSHYYWFNAGQGDVFINWTSRNFAGDVDLFVQNGLRLLTKIVVYADFGEVETGRVIYLRKPERLLLRVQGRTPNDEAAIYRLKFAGSFIAAAADENDIPVMPTVGESVAGAVRVNSVGTILPPLSKPVETKSATDSSTVDPPAEKAEAGKSDVEKQGDAKRGALEEKTDAPKLEVIVDDPTKKETPAKTTSRERPPRRTRTNRRAPVKTAAAQAAKESSDAKSSEKDANAGDETEAQKTIKEEAPAEKSKSSANVDPLANVQLVILFKDGSRIERPLPEVFRFTVDRGVLTVVAKDGRVGKYQMVDVAKVTIE